MGLHPDWGGSYFLPRLVGPSLASELVYTGEMINAERGEKLGIFNRVVPARDLDGVVRTFAGQLAAAPTTICSICAKPFRHSLELSLPEVLDAEIQAQLRAFKTPDFKEGIESFLEKRAPRFHKPTIPTR